MYTVSTLMAVIMIGVLMLVNGLSPYQTLLTFAIGGTGFRQASCP